MSRSLLIIVILALFTTVLYYYYTCDSAASVFKKSERSVVSITAYFGGVAPDTRLPEIDQLREACGFRFDRQGTGFFVSAHGHIVTAGHLVLERPNKAATFVVVTMVSADGTPSQYPATIIGIDGRGDVAVLHVHHQPSSLLRFGGTVSPGEPVILIGDPLGKNPRSCALGTVRDGQWTDPTQIIPLTAVLTDVSTSRGNSGSPLIGLDGRVMAMHTDTIETNVSSTSFGGGIAASHLSQIVDAMIQTCSIHMMQTTVDTVPRYRKVELPVSGLLPNHHRNYEHLYRSGVLSLPSKWVDTDGFLVGVEGHGLLVGDIITHVNGTSVGTSRTASAIGDVLWYLPPRETTSVTLTIVRQLASITCNMPVQQMPFETDISDNDGDQGSVGMDAPFIVRLTAAFHTFHGNLPSEPFAGSAFNLHWPYDTYFGIRNGADRFRFYVDQHTYFLGSNTDYMNLRRVLRDDTRVGAWTDYFFGQLGMIADTLGTPAEPPRLTMYLDTREYPGTVEKYVYLDNFRIDRLFAMFGIPQNNRTQGMERFRGLLAADISQLASTDDFDTMILAAILYTVCRGTDLVIYLT
jgi:S1-C subfamily serine protease